MPLQRINRIIGGADQGNIALLDQITNAHGRLLQFFIAQVPYFISGILVQNAGVTEVSLQFQMAPVEQGVADSLAQALSPFAELLVIGSVTGDVLFVHTAGTHETPLVVIAAQPYLSDVVELTILSNLLGIDMAMVVQNRCFFCVVVEQLFSGLSL